MGRSCNLRTVSTCTLRTVSVSCLLARRMSPPEGPWEWRWSSSVAIEDEDIFSSIMSWKMCQSKTLITPFSMTVHQARLSLLDQDTQASIYFSDDDVGQTRMKFLPSRVVHRRKRRCSSPGSLCIYWDARTCKNSTCREETYKRQEKLSFQRQHCFNIVLDTVLVTSEVRAQAQHHCKGFHLTRSFSSMLSAANIMYLLAFQNYQTSKLIDTVLGKHDDSGYWFR